MKSYNDKSGYCYFVGNEKRVQQFRIYHVLKPHSDVKYRNLMVILPTYTHTKCPYL